MFVGIDLIFKMRNKMSLTETFRGKKIRWTQESVFSKDFKLYADNEQIGEIKFPKLLSTTAEITMLGID